MLSFFRRLTQSRIGVIIVFAVLILIALAFAAGDITGLRPSGATGANTVAKVGATELTDAEMRQRIEIALGNLRRRGQPITVQEFIEQGGFEMVLDRTIESMALEEFARQTGIRVSQQMVDGEIAGNPSFQGIDGKFDQKKFDSLLANERVTAKALRDDLTRVRYGEWMLGRFQAGWPVPNGVVAPYASLRLERRQGVAGIVQTLDQDAGPDPDDKTLTAWYTTNKARYTVPQRRVLRYALIPATHFDTSAAATDAEIADAYKKAGARFAATEKRNVQMLMLGDQATANRVAGEVKGGKTLAAAAQNAGLEARNFDGVEKAELAAQASPEIADAAFGAAQGAVAGPVRTSLGFAVVRVDKIEAVAARSLEQARDELAKELTQKKSVAALAALRQKVDDEIGGGATFDELIAETKLQAASTAPLIANGMNPDDPKAQPDPALAPILRTGFTIEQDDPEPQLVQLDQNGGFAIVSLGRTVAAAPRPLASIREDVLRDYKIDKQLQKARAVAAEIVKKVNAGTPLREALAAAGATRAPATPFDMRRAELDQRAPPHVRMAFAMAPKTAKLVEAPNRNGYFVIYLEKVEEQDASADQALMGQARGALAQQISQDGVAQFLESVKRYLKITKNDAAIARLKADLVGPGGTN